MDSDLIVIDEIAPMEFKSPEFIKVVEDALGSDKNMLVVLHKKSNHPVARKIRNEFEVFTVMPENREVIVSTIAQKITIGLQ